MYFFAGAISYEEFKNSYYYAVFNNSTSAPSLFGLIPTTLEVSPEQRDAFLCANATFIFRRDLSGARLNLTKILLRQSRC
jgi:hypothetical protein